MASNVIVIQGEGLIVEDYAAAGAITPGHLIEVITAGTVQVHGTAAANAAKLFALDRPELGKGIDDAYALYDKVKAIYAYPGTVIYAWVAAAASAITKGMFLESAADGTLRLLTTDATTDDTQRGSVVAVADEAVDNHLGGTPARIRVRVI
jgi:hypothetical protein